MRQDTGAFGGKTGEGRKGPGRTGMGQESDLQRSGPVRRSWIGSERFNTDSGSGLTDALLKDFAVMLALVILLLAAVWTFDTGRYEWMLVTAIGMGIALNVVVAVFGRRKGKKYYMIFGILLAAACAIGLVYMLL